MISEQDGEMAHLVDVPSATERQFSADEDNFQEYICGEFETVWNCQSFQVDLGKEVEMIGKHILQPVAEEVPFT